MNFIENYYEKEKKKKIATYFSGILESCGDGFRNFVPRNRSNAIDNVK